MVILLADAGLGFAIASEGKSRRNLRGHLSSIGFSRHAFKRRIRKYSHPLHSAAIRGCEWLLFPVKAQGIPVFPMNRAPYMLKGLRNVPFTVYTV